MSQFNSRNGKKIINAFVGVSDVDSDDSADEWFETTHNQPAVRKCATKLVEKSKVILRKKKMDAGEKAEKEQKYVVPKIENGIGNAVKNENNPSLAPSSNASDGIEAEADKSDFSDDFDYDYIVDHNYHKREDDEPAALDAVRSQKDALPECEDPEKSPTTQNGAPTATELPNSNQILHAISNRDPRCRKRAIENDSQSSNAIQMDEEKGEGNVNEDDEENNEQTLADDEDVLDIFGDDDDFAEQSEITDPRPKRARTEVDRCQTSKVVVLQQPQLSKPTNQIVERRLLPPGPFKIPKLTENTQITIQNECASKPIPQAVTVVLQNECASKPIPQTVTVVRQNGVPLQPSTSNNNIRMIERVPIRQRLGILNGTDPSQLARTVNKNRSVQNSIGAAPKPPTPADQASRNRILQASQRLLMQSKQTEVKLTVPAAIAEKPCSSKEYVMPSFVTNPLENQPAFNVLFRGVCRKYIGDICNLPPAGCTFSHILPDDGHFRTKLDDIGPKNAVAIYDLFVVRSKKLFTRFAPVFCDYFGTHKLEASLQQMILDCCHPERRMFLFFTHIVDGFLKMGTSFEMALRKLITKVPKRTPQSNNMILKLILDERNTKLELFFNVLAALAKQDGFAYPIESVNRIVRIFVSNADHNEDLMMIIWNILTKVPMSQQQRIDNELLIQFYAKTSSKLGGTLPPRASNIDLP